MSNFIGWWVGECIIKYGNSSPNFLMESVVKIAWNERARLEVSVISKTRLYARPLGSKPAARISKNIEIDARIVAVALCNLTSFRPAFILSIPGSAVISLRSPSTIASSFHRDERRVRAVIPRSAAINDGAIEIASKGIQSRIINVGLASG